MYEHIWSCSLMATCIGNECPLLSRAMKHPGSQDGRSGLCSTELICSSTSELLCFPFEIFLCPSLISRHGLSHFWAVGVLGYSSNPSFLYTACKSQLSRKSRWAVNKSTCKKVPASLKAALHRDGEQRPEDRWPGFWLCLWHSLNVLTSFCIYCHVCKRAVIVCRSISNIIPIFIAGV